MGLMSLAAALRCANRAVWTWIEAQLFYCLLLGAFQFAVGFAAEIVRIYGVGMFGSED